MADSPARKPAGVQVARARALPKALIVFWGVFAVIVLGGIGVLQYLGPPPVPLLAAADIHHGSGAAMAPEIGRAHV